MTKGILIAVSTIAVAIAGTATVLAAFSGCVQTIQWARELIGDTALYLIGAFVAGAIVMHGIDRGLVAHRSGSGR
jgi:hypothetical protein